MSSSKQISPVKRLCSRCLSEFIDWRYSQSCWYFRPSFVNCCPSPLLSGSTLPLPCVNKYTEYTYSVCKGGRKYGVLRLRQLNTWRKVHLQVDFLDDDILHCFLWVLSFYGIYPMHVLSSSREETLLTGPSSSPQSYCYLPALLIYCEE